MAGINFGRTLGRLLILVSKELMTLALYLADTWMTNENGQPIEIGWFGANK